MGDSIDLRNFPFCRASKLWGSVLSVNSNMSFIKVSTSEMIFKLFL